MKGSCESEATKAAVVSEPPSDLETFWSLSHLVPPAVPPAVLCQLWLWVNVH